MNKPQIITINGIEYELVPHNTTAPVPRLDRAPLYADYFFINDDGTIECFTEEESTYNDKHYALGNYFFTYDEAAAAVQKLLEYRKEQRAHHE